MNTTLTKFILPLAALALGSVACDPFPAAPTGAPAIVRVTTYGGSLGTSNSVAPDPGGNTVSTDYAEPDGIIRVQFNKPMDGSSIQKYPNYNPDGTTFVPPTDPDTVGIRDLPVDLGATPPRTVAVPDPGLPYDICTPASNVTLTGFAEVPGVKGVYDFVTHDFAPNTGTYPIKNKVCNDPSSSTDGASLVLTPAVLMAYGTTYRIGGTVKDYEGNPLTLNVSLTVDKRPLPFGQDGYTAGIDWFDSLADSYELFWSPTGVAGSFLSLGSIDPAVDCDGVTCFALHTERAPQTDYYYQVNETTGTTTTTRPAAVSPATTLSALTPTLGVVSTPTVPPTIIPGVIRVAWGTIQGVSAYTVEQSTDGGTTWAVVATQTLRTYYAGTPPPSTTAPTTGPGTLTTGTTYTFRVTPAYTSGFAAVKGNAASKVAP